jgi:S1-C subfamily serine protease
MGSNNIQALHERVLYPVVRVRTDSAGGSGTVIQSLPDPRKEGEYLTFILTNWHVIERAIEVKKRWNSVLKREIDSETFKQVTVEIFDYVRQSEVTSANTHRADIIAYDRPHDLAILKLDSPRQVEHVARLMSAKDAAEVRLFTPLWTSGCSLGHDPFANPGFLTYLHEQIESKLYWMCNANSIFGNSGGGVFHGETHEQIGVTARISSIQLGFGYDIMTWMGFFIPVPRIYEFLGEQELQFLYDPDDSYYASMERRKEKERDGLLSLWADRERSAGAVLPGIAPRGWGK